MTLNMIFMMMMMAVIVPSAVMLQNMNLIF